MSAQVMTNDLVTEMVKTGLIFGHKKSKTHPRMKPFISGNRNEVELIDPQATLDSLEAATNVIKEKLKAGGLVLLVGTSAAARGAIEEMARELKQPYVTNRWLGGTLTNFKVINARLKYYEESKSKKERGEFAKYTKKEQLELTKEIGKLSKGFGGLAAMIKVPDLIFIVDVKVHGTAVREARTLKIPIVAIVDTDDDPELVNYPIFANDHNKSSVEWIIGKIKEGVKNG